jgi:hypothetical protein
MASDTGSPGQAPSQVLQILNAFLTVQALHVAAVLRIADRLADGPQSVDDLADGTGAHRGSLYRLMRLLGAVGVVREDEDARFALTPLGGALAAKGRARSGIGRCSSAPRRCGRSGAGCARAL